MTQIRTFPSETWERHSDSTVNHDTSSEEDDYEAYKMNKEVKISAIKNFRKKVAYQSKPSLSDLFASQGSDIREGDSSESDTKCEASKRRGFRSLIEATSSGVIQPYQMVDHPIATRSPPKDHKGKRKRSKQSPKSHLKESTPRTTTPLLVNLFDNWVEPDFEVGDEVTFNSDVLGVAGIGTV
jgi:hypothetical protein